VNGIFKIMTVSSFRS